MAVRALRSAPAEHVEDLAYLMAHLKADPQATAFAPNLEAASVALKTQIEDWNSKRHAVKETQTGLGNVEETLANVVRTAHAVILDDLRHNHQSPRFLTYFPRGLVAITRASYQDQLTSARALAQRCAQDPSPKVQEQAGLLEAAASQMDTAFARRGAARVAESVAYGQLQIQKLATMDACRRVGYRLAELYPDERDRVRSYFRKTYRQPRPATPTTGAPEPATGTAATGAAATVAPAGLGLVLNSTEANL